MNNIKLDLNINPKMKSYSDISYYQAIMTAQKYYSENIAEICDFEFLGQKEDLKFESNAIEYKKTGANYFNFYTNPNKNNIKCRMYAICSSDNCKISFKVKKHCYYSPWSLIGIFISEQIPKNLIKSKHTEYDNFIGCYKKTGITIKQSSNWSEVNDESISDNEYCLSAFVDKKKLTLRVEYQNTYKEYSTEIAENKITIGLYLDFDENAYVNWLYSNFIQLEYGPRILNDKPLDYFMPIEKRNNKNYNNPFLKLYELNYNVLFTLKIDFSKLVKTYLSNGIYLDVYINEFYIKNRKAYNSYKYYHSNLIYGFDDDREIFNIMGYDSQGMLIVSELEYKNFKKAISEDINKVMQHSKGIQYYMDYFSDSFDPKLLIDYLKEYINSENSSYKYRALSHFKTEKCFGISLYDYYSSEYTDDFIFDYRISYILYEHKLIMVDRLKFLYERNYLTNKEYKELTKVFNVLLEKSEMIKNLIIKYKILPNEKTKKSIINNLIEMKSIEAPIIRELIKFLSGRK